MLSIYNNLINKLSKLIDSLIDSKTSDLNLLYNLNILISEFLSVNELDVDFDFYIELINSNKKLDSLLNTIFSNETNLKENIKLNHIISLIHGYCILHNIEFYDLEIDKENIEDNIVSAYLNSLNYPILSKQETDELFYKLRDGDLSAKEKIIKHNLKLVVSVAHHYVKMGVDYIDLIQEGNIGLINAVEKYNVDLGYCFSTYAFYAIKSYVIRAINKYSKQIRIPSHVEERVMQYNSIKKEFTLSDEAIAKKMNLPLHKVKELNILPYTVSLESVASSEYDADLYKSTVLQLQDITPDNMSDPVIKVIDSSLKSDVINLLHKLNLKPIELDIILLHYGFYGSEIPLVEIAKKLGVTRENIRQKKETILRKIRKSKYCEQLAELTDYPNKAMKNVELYFEKLTPSTRDKSINCFIDIENNEKVKSLKKEIM